MKLSFKCAQMNVVNTLEEPFIIFLLGQDWLQALIQTTSLICSKVIKVNVNVSLQQSEGIMTDIHDSQDRRRQMMTKVHFMGDRRGVAMSLCLDRLNPWSKNMATYSI